MLAVAAGIGAMYGVHWLITSIGRLGQDATLRVKSALGHEGTVYVPIDGEKAQAGKIQLNVQNRLVEFEAVTSLPQRLPTGASQPEASRVMPAARLSTPCATKPRERCG